MACTLVITHPNPGTDLSKAEYDANHDVIGDADDLDESATRKWAGETGADVTDATNVNAAGAVMESDGISISNDGTKTTIAGTAGDYNRIGDAGTTNHGLNSEDDFMVTGDFETKGAAYFDGAVTFGSTASWNINPASLSTGEWLGPTRTATAGENLVFGNLCYLKSDGKFWKTLATASATSTGHLCVALGTIAADASGTFLECGGYFRLDTLSFTEGCILYVGRDTSGSFRETDLTTTGDIKRIAGYCDVDDGTIYFLPSTDWGVIA